MKIIGFLLLSLLSLCAKSSQDERIIFGGDLITKKFETFKLRHNTCMEESKKNILSKKTINTLQKFPISTGESLGYLNLKAIRLCASPEYNDLTRLLLTVESANRDSKNIKVQKQIANIKLLLFPIGEFVVEKKYYELSDKTKIILNNIKELNEPFDMVNAFERAWLN